LYRNSKLECKDTIVFLFAKLFFSKAKIKRVDVILRCHLDHVHYQVRFKMLPYLVLAKFE